MENIKIQKSKLELSNILGELHNEIEIDDDLREATKTAIKGLEALEDIRKDLLEQIDNENELHNYGRVYGLEIALETVNKYIEEL